MTHMALRVWRNRPEYRFSGRVHEQKTAQMPTYLPERWEHTAIRVRHYGYLNQRIRAREKSQRNIELLEQEAREQPSPFNDFNLGSEFLALGRDRRGCGPVRSRLGRAARAARLGLGRGTRRCWWPGLPGRAARAGDIVTLAVATGEGLAIFPDHTDLVFEAALCHQAAGRPGEARRARGAVSRDRRRARRSTPRPPAPARSWRSACWPRSAPAQGRPDESSGCCGSRWPSIPSTWRRCCRWSRR